MEHSPDLAATGPAGLVASARESMAVLSETLWAAARPEDLLDVTVELPDLGVGWSAWARAAAAAHRPGAVR